jgi:hypothetical protein
MSQNPIPQQPPARRAPPPLPKVPIGYRGTPGGLDDAVWHAMGRLCAMDQALLPPRCVKCNSTENIRMKRKQFTWAPPWALLGLLGGLLPWLILTLVLQKKATITYGLCPMHRRKQLMVVWICLSLTAFCILLIVLAIAYESGLLAIGGILVFLGMLVYAIIAGHAIKPQKIDNGIAEFKGCGQDFLLSLPSSQWN